MKQTLTEQTMSSLKACFKERGNNLSEGQWMALEDLVNTLEGMANESLKPLFYLSPLDPGIGKTTAIIHFIQHLLADKTKKEVSAIIFVDTIKQIESLVEAFGDAKIDQKDFSVLVSEPKELETGNPDRQNARVLITTQQMLESRSKRYASYEEIEEFQYKGEARQVRAWDEAMLPARSITLDTNRILAMYDPLSLETCISEALKKFVTLVLSEKVGNTVTIPDLGLTQHLISMRFEGETEKVRNTAYDLHLLQGREVVVHKAANKVTLLEYEHHLPENLEPILITDASGRVRGTYKQWSKGRSNLVVLRDSQKRYTNLTVNVWTTGGSKSVWKDERRKDNLIEGIAKTINSKPDEDWLVIHHKKTSTINNHDIPASIRSHLKMRNGKVHFAHWNGEDAKATNDYRDVSNIIMAGTLFYDEAYYEGLLRSSRKLRVKQSVTSRQLSEIRAGEHAHLILQAACRGSIRKSQGDDCHPCNLYVIASRKSGIKSLFDDKGIFPGCEVREWQPVPKIFPERVEDAQIYIHDFFFHHPFIKAENNKLELKVSEVASHLKMDRDNFNSDVLHYPGFEDVLLKEGIKLERKRGRGGSFFRRIQPEENRKSA